MYLANLEKYFTLGIIFIVLLLVLFLAAYILISKKKGKVFLIRGMNLSLFLVTLPQRTDREKEVKISLEEHLKTAEQFYSSLTGIKEHNIIKRIFYGNHAFIFEISV